MSVDNTKISVLGKYREMDELTPQGEVDPQNETLNPARVRNYLEQNGFTVKNFDQRFNFKTAMDIVGSRGTRGEAQMYSELAAAQSYLERIGLPNLMEQSSEGAFRSTLNKELLKRNEGQMEEKLNQAYQIYQKVIRDLCRRSLIIKEQFKERREAEKVPAEKSLTEEIAGVANDIKKNWKGMTGGEKLALTGLLGVGLIMFIRSDNEKVKAFREDLVGALKVAGIGVGGAVGLGLVYKLATGESPLKSLNDVVQETAGKDTFMTEAFKTDAEKAALLRKSMVYMGDKDFMDMARRYREAKAINSDEVRLPTVFEKDMSAKEVYTALDVFFSRYPAEKLEQRYRNYQPRASWDEVITTEMAEDGLLSYNGSLVDRTIKNVEEYATRGWNWLLVGEGFGVAKSLYLKAFGKNGTDEEVQEWLKKNKDNVVSQQSDLDKYFEEKLTHKDAANFTKALLSPPVPGENIQFIEDSNDIYVIASVPFQLDGNEKAMSVAMQTGLERADSFLKKRIPEIGENVARFREVPDRAQVRVQKEGMLISCVRCPKKGSPEFDLKLHGLQKSPAYEERRSLEIFGPTNNIEYGKLAPGDQAKIRLQSSLSSNQTAEIDKICDWFTRKYRTQNLPFKTVFEKLFSSEADMKQALEESGITKQELKGHLLPKINEELEDIEEWAAKDLKADLQAYENAKRDFQNTKGYMVRLALIGDPDSQQTLKFDPSKDDPKDLKNDYKNYCEKRVKAMNKGII